MAESGGSRGGVQPGRINGTMMDGMLPAKASASIGGAIDAEGLYGNRRPHVGIGMMAPAEVSKTAGDRDMRRTGRRQG